MTQLSILLDLDGTLVDSQPGILASFRTTLRSLGHQQTEPIDPALVIGPPLAEGMKALLKLYDDSRVAEAISIYRLDYDASGFSQSAIYPGIPTVLEHLRSAGVRLFVATSKRTDVACKILEHLEIATLFEKIYGAEPGGVFDHKSELIAHIIARHSLLTAASLMVGDRGFDILGAHTNQVPAAGALWGYGSRRELETAGADFLLDEPAELLALVRPGRLLVGGGGAPMADVGKAWRDAGNSGKAG